MPPRKPTRKPFDADKAAGAPAPAVVPDPAPKAKEPSAKSVKEQIATLEARIAADKAALALLLNPPQEWPKMVDGVTYASPADLASGTKGRPVAPVSAVISEDK